MATWKNRPNRKPDMRIPFYANYGRDKHIWYLYKVGNLWRCGEAIYTQQDVDYHFRKGAWIKILTFKDYLKQAELL